MISLHSLIFPTRILHPDISGTRLRGYLVCSDLHHYRKKIHGDKTLLDFNLDSTVNDKQKGLLKHFNNKRKIRDNADLLLDEVSLLTNRSIHIAEIFNAFFASVFNTDYGLWNLAALC